VEDIEQFLSEEAERQEKIEVYNETVKIKEKLKKSIFEHFCLTKT
jgi:hypothetical protein